MSGEGQGCGALRGSGVQVQMSLRIESLSQK